MNFESFWDKLLRGKGGNALRNDQNVLMSVDEFRRLLALSYQHGQGEANNDDKSLFDAIFGSKFFKR